MFTKQYGNFVKKILITGGAGFIGSAVIRYIINNTNNFVINVDKLTYASNLSSLIEIENNPRYTFEKADICDSFAMKRIFTEHQPDLVMNLAAETHVDRSITEPEVFIQTNIIGTYVLLKIALQYWLKMENKRKLMFRFHHISTDEVYGDLPFPQEIINNNKTPLFTETTPYVPSSPYSSSKASSDHLVQAWHRTYGLPTLLTNCSNNYGPYHFPEKLIPLTITNALAGKPLTVYGNGEQIRDWLFVDDHARALYKVVTKGVVGEKYNIGGYNEYRNVDVVKIVCSILDEIVVNKPVGIFNFAELITYVSDRPGHDRRYAIDASKIKNDLGWVPEETFESGIRKTITWYLDNENWWKSIKNNSGVNEHFSLLNSIRRQ